MVLRWMKWGMEGIYVIRNFVTCTFHLVLLLCPANIARSGEHKTHT
jgi:hypothetical protein